MLINFNSRKADATAPDRFSNDIVVPIDQGSWLLLYHLLVISAFSALKVKHHFAVPTSVFKLGIVITYPTKTCGTSTLLGGPFRTCEVKHIPELDFINVLIRLNFVCP